MMPGGMMGNVMPMGQGRMGPPPMGGAEPPQAFMQAIQQMQGNAPTNDASDQILGEAASLIGQGLAQAYGRSPEAATLLSKAMTMVMQARQKLQEAAQSPLGGVPDLGALGLGGGSMPMGPPSGPR